MFSLLNLGAKLLFLTLRQKTVTAQSILVIDEAVVSKQMLKFATRYESAF
jgi:hypothetical protein